MSVVCMDHTSRETRTAAIPLLPVGVQVQDTYGLRSFERVGVYFKLRVVQVRRRYTIHFHRDISVQLGQASQHRTLVHQTSSRDVLEEVKHILTSPLFRKLVWFPSPSAVRQSRFEDALNCAIVSLHRVHNSTEIRLSRIGKSY